MDNKEGIQDEAENMPPEIGFLQGDNRPLPEDGEKWQVHKETLGQTESVNEAISQIRSEFSENFATENTKNNNPSFNIDNKGSSTGIHNMSGEEPGDTINASSPDASRTKASGFLRKAKQFLLKLFFR